MKIENLNENENKNKNEHEATMSFEDASIQLELIVSQLESGDVPLEKAIELYQEGMKLSKLCTEKLKFVEQQIELLVEGDSKGIRKPFLPQQEDRVTSFE